MTHFPHIRHSRSLLERSAAFVLLVAVAWTGSACARAEASFEFSDNTDDTHRFHRWYDEIELTAEQEAVMKEALGPLPAPCCEDRSAYTCCCECNLGRSWWGLSKYLITEEGAGAEEVRAAVEQWFERINADGFSGDVCYTRGCGRAFADNGCGGMSPHSVHVE